MTRIKGFFGALALGAFAVTAALGVNGCDEADEALDCQQVCDRYDDCGYGGDNFSVGDCRENCQDAVDKDSALENRLDDCAQCLDNDMTCTETVFECGTRCASLVPTVARP